MMHHDAIAVLRVIWGNAWPGGNNDSARFVPGDHLVGTATASQTHPHASGPSVHLKIASADARRFHLKDNLTGFRSWVRHINEINLPIARKNHSTHFSLSFFRVREPIGQRA